jgi:hypothetical protein
MKYFIIFGDTVLKPVRHHFVIPECLPPNAVIGGRYRESTITLNSRFPLFTAFGGIPL